MNLFTDTILNLFSLAEFIMDCLSQALQLFIVLSGNENYILGMWNICPHFLGLFHTKSVMNRLHESIPMQGRCNVNFLRFFANRKFEYNNLTSLLLLHIILLFLVIYWSRLTDVVPVDWTADVYSKGNTIIIIHGHPYSIMMMLVKPW